MIEYLKNNKNKIRTLIGMLFIIYVFGLCLSIAVKTNYNSAPDEEMKYYICEYISNNMKLPHGADEAIRDSSYGISYGFTPILSYMISGFFMYIVKLFVGKNLFTVARLVSALCIVAYAYVCIKISKKLFSGVYSIFFLVLCVLLPQIIYLGGYINNDSLAMLSIAIIFYSWLLGLESNWNWKSCIILSIGIGICFLSYYNAYGYILCSFIIYVVSSYIKRMDIKEFFKKGFAIVGIVFLIAGWWFIRSYIIYDGDILGLNTSRKYGEIYAKEQLKPSNRGEAVLKGKSLKYVLIDMGWLKSTTESFVGKFGYMNVNLSELLYGAYDIFFIIGILGLLLMIINKCRNRKNSNFDTNSKIKILFNIVLILSIIIPIVLSLYYTYHNDFQPQGRYIMPMLIPFMYYITIGFESIFELLFKNDKTRNIIMYSIITIWTIMPLYITINYILKELVKG